ncbi:hypothetical protein [Micromonospora sp. NPDC006431]|uniref:hypothetical protein n=1 Tax=Micromonospora sp. NPDC006431 TaxID=3364235 RepID=UPI003692E00D
MVRTVVPPAHCAAAAGRQLPESTGTGDLDEFGEGAYYLHLHQPCGFAAVNYQQS